MKKEKFFIIVISVLLFVASCGTFTYTGEYCEDGIQDRYETDIDCGGRYCDPCEEGSSCEEGSDCESDSCVDDVCAAAVTDTTTTTDTTATVTDYCTDTDGGLNYVEKGTISGGRWYYTEAAYTSKTDSCIATSGQLQEFHCIDIDASVSYVNCEDVVGTGYTCSDGACV